jgi:molybdopterin converting factor small subunit
MVTIKLFGILRLNSGISTLKVNAKTVGEAINEISTRTSIKKNDIRYCTIFVNGKLGKNRTKLIDGDEVVFLSPVGGG